MKSQKDTYLDIFNSIDFEKIIDHPNILIAANFWDQDRFKAAKTCYKFMRSIDDLIDDHKASNGYISESDKKQFTENVDKWVKMIFNGNTGESFQKELTETIVRFRIPLWPMEAFGRSMVYDINNDGFPTMEAFLEYAGGASVAPAAIFVHLAGLREKDGNYIEPAFNVREAASSCAIFSYLVHIIRDFQKDQKNNLNYFAEDVIARSGLTRRDLLEMSKGREINAGFRNMVAEYYKLADIYRVKTYNCIADIWPYLEPRYQLSLEIIFELYLMVFERIDIQNGTFSTEELNPSYEESKERVFRTIVNSKTLAEISTVRT